MNSFFDVNTKSKVREERRQINQRKTQNKFHQKSDSKWK
jgi:hypothetical protein